MSNQELRLLIKNELYILKLNHKLQFTTKIYKKYKLIIDSATQFLNNNSKVGERVYCYINNITKCPKCHYCKTKVKFNGVKAGYHKFCSKKCVANGTKEEKIITNNNKYGCDNPMQNEEIQKSVENTNLKKYGVKNVFQAEEIKKKIKTVTNKIYGCDHNSQSKKIKQQKINTNRKHRGVDNPSQCNITQQKKINTYQEKYNVNHHMQDSKMFKKHQKSALKLKKYKLPSGKIIKVQGYEPFALDVLLETYRENQILTDVIDMPEIWYYYNDKSHRYYCDIFIPHENKLIEIKSFYIYEKEKSRNLLKQKASRDLGYNHEMWIINNKGNVIQII